MKKVFDLKRVWRWTTFLLLVAPLGLHAHTLQGDKSSFAAGFHHPLHGLDHVLAMIMVGIWATQISRSAMWKVPLIFVSVMMLGGVFGFTGIPVPFVESGIIASLLVLGALVAGAVRVPIKMAICIVGIFALFHGYAHGLEMPKELTSYGYSLGFVCATILLHLSGICVAFFTHRYRYNTFLRYVGVSTAITGIVLCFQ
jgi:urease accessory protein